MLGIIVGESNLPKYLIYKLVKNKIKFIILDITKKNLYKNYKNSYKLHITQLGKAISILKRNNCNKIILIGKVTRPELSFFKIDKTTLFNFSTIFRAFKKGDGFILKEIIKIFKKNNIKVLNSMTYTKELIFSQKNLNNVKTTTQDLLSIKKGVSILNSLSKYDIAQAVIVNNGFVLAVEGPEGTDEAIRRSGKISRQLKLKNKSILIKLPKLNQDIRTDLPTLGYLTVKNCIKNNIKGIAIKKSKNIILEKDKIFRIAKNNNFFIKGL